MIALPDGVDVYVGSRRYVGSIPDHLCPDHLKPAPPAESDKPEPAPAKARKTERTDEQPESVG